VHVRRVTEPNDLVALLGAKHARLIGLNSSHVMDVGHNADALAPSLPPLAV
jgi:hypothetical protein